MDRARELIKRLTDSDILGGRVELLPNVTRFASRGVLLDEQGNVGMMYMSEPQLYKLPGGGIEAGEQPEEAFLREIMEETGYRAEIVRKFGYIEEHKKRNNFFQYSYCFLAKTLYKEQEASLSEEELFSGMSLKWLTVSQAIEVMEESLRNVQDYSDTFMLLRDKTILETYFRGLQVIS